MFKKDRPLAHTTPLPSQTWLKGRADEVDTPREGQSFTVKRSHAHVCCTWVCWLTRAGGKERVPPSYEDFWGWDLGPDAERTLTVHINLPVKYTHLIWYNLMYLDLIFIKRKTLFTITYIWNLREKTTNEYNKTEADSQIQRTNSCYQWEEELGGGSNGWRLMHKNYLYKIHKQQGYTLQHRGKQSLFHNNLKWSIMYKTIISLCYKPETYIMLNF